MKYGFEDDKFFIEIPGNKRKPGNMREESDARALEIAASSNKIMVSMSSGIDSQSIVCSLRKYDIPFECSFLYCPGYNDNEYEQLSLVEKKFGFKTHIVDMDPMKVKDRVIEESDKFKIQRNQIFQKLYLELLPEDYDFVQMTHDPCVFPTTKDEYFYYSGYHCPEVARDRAFSLLKRSGKYIFYGDTSEFLYSIITDDVYVAALYSHLYFDGNGLNKPGIKLTTVDRWDYYIKPLIYGKYWKDDLIYFPKFAGFENIPYLYEHLWHRENVALIPYHQMIKHMENNDDMKYFQNYHEVINES